jgi:hypothetical protein
MFQSAGTMSWLFAFLGGDDDELADFEHLAGETMVQKAEKLAHTMNYPRYHIKFYGRYLHAGTVINRIRVLSLF